MLRQGKLDISPSSSVEYIRNKKKYFILPWFTISSFGPINSILLFSKLPIEKLGGKTIAVSSHTETSALLLKVILRDFLSLKCRFRTTKSGNVKKILSSLPAVLLIGDEAMKEAKKIQGTEKNKKFGLQTRNSQPVTRNSALYIYDLGELWFNHTGLPFVFALWIVRKDVLPEKIELVKKLASDLLKAGEYAPKKFSAIAKQAPQGKWLDEKELVKFWKGISYDFTEKHMQGLRMFEKYAFKKNK